MKILFLSNGRGEDSLAVVLIKALQHLFAQKHLHHLQTDAFPIIGDGEAYKKDNIAVVGVGQHLPSRGFGGASLSHLYDDIKAGLISTALRQVGLLSNISKAYDHVIAVGDIYPVIIASFFTRKPIVHVATAVSVSYKKFGFLETQLLKRKCKEVFTRDEATAAELARKGVNAKFLGNIMMDDPNLSSKDAGIDIDADKTVIALIPSSRADAAENVASYLKVIGKFGGSYEIVLSVFSEHQFGEIVNNMVKGDWEIDKSKDWKTPLIGKIFKKDGPAIKVFRGHFGDILRRSNIVIGSTGTGSEQAAGLGKPLIILRAEGPHTSSARVNMYSKMLSGAVFVPEGTDEDIAKKIEGLLKDASKLREMAEAGKSIMGGPGASQKIAEEIIKTCQSA